MISKAKKACYSSSLYGYSSGTCFKSFTCNSNASSPLSISRTHVTSVFIDTWRWEKTNTDVIWYSNNMQALLYQTNVLGTKLQSIESILLPIKGEKEPSVPFSFLGSNCVNYLTMLSKVLKRSMDARKPFYPVFAQARLYWGQG